MVGSATISTGVPLGLKGREGSAERMKKLDEVHKTLEQNYGFKARNSVVEALTNNTKISNQDPRRGQVVDIST